MKEPCNEEVRQSNRPEVEEVCSPRSSDGESLLSSLAVEGEKAFARDLLHLLRERPGQWVAYHGERQLGFARTSTELYEKCWAEGIAEDDFIVHRIEAETPEEKIPPLDVDLALSLRLPGASAE